MQKELGFHTQVKTDSLFIPNWKWKLLSCVRLCVPMDYTIHGILQARILEWVIFPYSRGSSQPRYWTQVSHIAGGFFTSWAIGNPKNTGVGSLIPSPADLHARGIEERSSCIVGRFFTNWAMREALYRNAFALAGKYTKLHGNVTQTCMSKCFLQSAVTSQCVTVARFSTFVL